jgi:hydrogenase maturation protease
VTPLVVGLGNRDRGDDAVGLLVGRRMAGDLLPGVEVVEQVDPVDLVLGWGEHAWAVVSDAVVSGAPPGTVIVAEIGDTGPGSRTWARLGLGGTHAFGLAEAVELSRSLGRLPARVTLVGVEAADVTPGAGLSPEVARAVPEAVERIRDLLSTAKVGGPDVPR